MVKHLLLNQASSQAAAPIFLGSTKENTYLAFTAVSKELINRLLNKILFSSSVFLIPKSSKPKEEIHLNTKFTAMKYLPFLHLKYDLHFQH